MGPLFYAIGNTWLVVHVYAILFKYILNKTLKTKTKCFTLNLANMLYCMYSKKTLQFVKDGI